MRETEEASDGGELPSDRQTTEELDDGSTAPGGPPPEPDAVVVGDASAPPLARVFDPALLFEGYDEYPASG